MIPTQEKKIDRERVTEIQRMLAQPGGAKRVAQKYGEAVTASPEYQLAERRRANAAKRQAEQAKQAALDGSTTGTGKAGQPKATTQPNTASGTDVTAQKVQQDRARRVQKRAEQREREAREGRSR